MKNLLVLHGLLILLMLQMTFLEGGTCTCIQGSQLQCSLLTEDNMFCQGLNLG